MDEGDQAQVEEEIALREAVARRRKTLTACGRCHYCNEGVAAGSLFCEPECASEYEYERERAIRAAQGR